VSPFCDWLCDRSNGFRSFIGYSNANYALAEVRDPVRTLKRAAPIAMSAVTIVYLLVNIAYFGVVSKADIVESRRIVAYGSRFSLTYCGISVFFLSFVRALFFRNLFGAATEKVRIFLLSVRNMFSCSA